MNDGILDSFVDNTSVKNSLSKSFNPESYNVTTEGKIHKQTKRKSSKSEATLDDDDLEDRKKRDTMNDKIQELLSLVPDEYFHVNKDRSSGTKDGKPNKGQILTKGVEYIQDLQNKIDENNRKEVELIWKLKKLLNANNLGLPADINLNNTSAEIVLSEIGVGPLASAGQPIPAVQGSGATTTKSPNNNFEYGGYDQYS